MTKDVDIRALAELAQLDVSSAEIEKLQKEIPEILEFVESIQRAAGEAKAKDTAHRNVLRADDSPHEGGIHTEELLRAAAARDGNRIAVKQVVKRTR